MHSRFLVIITSFQVTRSSESDNAYPVNSETASAFIKDAQTFKSSITTRSFSGLSLTFRAVVSPRACGFKLDNRSLLCILARVDLSDGAPVPKRCSGRE